MSSRLLAAGLLILGVCGSIVAVLLKGGLSAVQNQRDIQLEIVKACLNIIVVVVFGSTAKLLGDRWQRRKQQKDARRQFREKMLVDLVDAYSDVKQGRRILRARAFDRDGKLDLNIYDSQQEALSKARLRIEGILRRVEANHVAFGNQLQGLIDALSHMESHLDNLSEEWEVNMKKFTQSVPPADVAEHFHALRRFIGSSSEGTFREDFGSFYKIALRILQENRYPRANASTLQNQKALDDQSSE